MFSGKYQVWFCVLLGSFILSTRRRQWQATPVLLPRKSHGWRSLVGCSPWGRYELDATERLHFYFSLSHNGEGNGNPLQCSCLENPKDGRAWWAAVCGVTQGRTRLRGLSSSILSTPHLYNSLPILGFPPPSPWNHKLLKYKENALLIFAAIPIWNYCVFSLFCLWDEIPRWLSGKESACQRRRCRRRGFDPSVRKISWRRAWQPTPVFLPGEAHGQRHLSDNSP